jgi:hypothetical protein
VLLGLVEGCADAAEHAATAAARGGATQIFRNVGAEEFDSIALTGRFSTAEGQMEGELPPVFRTPDLRWPSATGKDVRHARTTPSGVPAARCPARP